MFNRSIDNKTIFNSSIELNRFLNLIRFYGCLRPIRFSKLTVQQRELMIKKNGGEPIVEIICYCLMPNHFHLLLKQLNEGGITSFLRKISDGYSRYFNLIHHRAGPLFQNNFKAVRIATNEQLLHVSRYIHLNPLTAYLVNNLDDYLWSSYHEYISSSDLRNSDFTCNKKLILDQFKKKSGYRAFVLDNANYQKKLKEIQYLLIENPT